MRPCKPYVSLRATLTSDEFENDKSSRDEVEGLETEANKICKLYAFPRTARETVIGYQSWIKYIS